MFNIYSIAIKQVQLLDLEFGAMKIKVKENIFGL